MGFVLGGVVGCGSCGMFVCLKSFVMNVISLSVYVNVAHVCFVWYVSGCDGGRG